MLGPYLSRQNFVLGFVLGLEAHALGLGLVARGLGVGLATQGLGLGFGLDQET